ncbi:hypothetical protein CLAFUW4_07317 [Fulvia fulva]|uniref:Myb-like DNA-binding domain-containing protein n=1 Tax=Passalora fulva TaxID=5499 RepID=A0A9Q8PA22_PASFU|nr:uncharacterized protein CLAFUR5_07446 [Fulvia fulva]KAK4622319.1 hypothetical protein CLAFUR4_07324 [Fulvia fulva]KAK4623350.1 hypothetical protein CLAFUR0_07322 [Fulvia fulva]UJO18643.1 hypothetical protein CLAFUR5_07446 [Fulvia fulva]WPV16084.1 hypothetical protein CLAFUW4_07317 [Fulvia fulva]WPV31162.1 hypothetical protein CLAFUW7_07318 [Fulvia fulva]
MAPVTNELFLLSCINHATNGKIDFKAVAVECGMNTQGAAPSSAMRFRRFKEKHDTSLLNSASSLTAAKNGEGDDGDSEVPAKKTSPKKKPTPKKRKIDEVAVKDEPEDDEDLV